MARKNVNEVSRETSASCSTSDLRYRLLMAALGPEKEAAVHVISIDPAPIAPVAAGASRKAKLCAD